MRPDPLLQPLTLGHLTLRNRIISSAHAPSFAELGHPRARYRLYHEEKARGGVALTMIGGSTNIAPDSPSVFGQLYAGDEDIVPWFQQLTDAVRRQGAGVMCQITHMGRRTASDNGHWLPVMGPSNTRERAHRAQPKAMEHEDIRRVISQFAAAAQRCQRGGFDGVELLSHSHLLGQFLSPQVNLREDDYGGSLENRLRLTLQVLEAVREAVGEDFILSMRITGDELSSGGLSAADCVMVAQRLAATGALDCLNILAGAPYDDLGLASWVAPMGMPSAPHLTIAGQILRAVDIPVLHAGAVADIATARHALSTGQVDAIGMTRAQIADPYLVEKLIDGQEARIRPCVGLGYCVDRVNQGKAMVCGHNVATGREATLPHKIARAQRVRKVVVVGAGPAGLEAARISAERGHEVLLFEAGDRLGGQLNLAAKSSTRRQIAGIGDWLVGELERLNVTVHFNHYVEADEILATCADVVLLATGGWPGEPPIAGAAHALSSWDVLAGAVPLQGEVLVFDEIGDHAGAACAQVLADAGCAVTLISPDRTLLHDLGPTNSAVLLRDLARKDVNFICLYELQALEQSGKRLQASLRHVLTGDIEQRRFDAVVVENGVLPMDELYFALKPLSRNLGQLAQNALIAGTSPFVDHNPGGEFVLARLGDAVAGRNIHAALLDAMRICKDL